MDALVDNTVQLTLKNGMVINGFKGDLITNDIERHGVFDRELVYLLNEILQRFEEPTCIDVGANIGMMSLIMSQYSKNVISIEPVPEIFRLLEKNIAENSIENITAVNCALSRSASTVPIFNVSPTNVGMHTLNPVPESAASRTDSVLIQTVQGDALAEISGLNSLELIKIDVEGHETEAILGLKNTLSRFEPIVILEWNSEHTREGFRKHDIFGTVFKNYRLYTLDHRIQCLKRAKNKLVSRPVIKFLKYLQWKASSRAFRHQGLLDSHFDVDRDYSSIVLLPVSKNLEGSLSYLFFVDPL